MKELTLERWAYTPMGTFGTLTLPEFRCRTVELPWLNNRPWVSCIPTGSYVMCQTQFFSGGYDTYELLDVPDRSLIKIHIANTVKDILGCIGLGLELGCVSGLWAVLRSRDAFNGFTDMMNGDPNAGITISDMDPKDLPR